MIKNIVVGDITSPANPYDIIIGMNSTLSDVTGIGLPFVQKIAAIHPIVPGSVLSFEFTPERHVHMVICHDIGETGWIYADRYVRFGMDYLWHTERGRCYSIVQIGTGRVGKRDGADPAAIRSAMAASYLPVDLDGYDPGARQVVDAAVVHPPLRAFRAWHPTYGEERIAA